MKILYIAIPFFLSSPVLAEPVMNGDILDSSGVVDELLSVSFSMSLTRAIKYYQSQEDIVLSPDAYLNTIKSVSDKLNMQLNPAKYARFNGLSYANIFLNSQVVNVKMFNASDLSSDYSKYPASISWVSSLPSGTFYQGELGEASLYNPLPLFSMKIVPDTLISDGVARFTKNSGADVYQLRYKEGYIVADRADKIADFLSGLYEDGAYKFIYQQHAERESILTNTYDDKGNLMYSHCSLTMNNIKNLIPRGSYNDYSVNGSSVNLNSSYEIEIKYSGVSVCVRPDGSFPDDRQFSKVPFTDKQYVTINAPRYYPVEIRNMVKTPFDGDATLLMSYSAAMRRTALLASAFSLLLNSAWAAAAADENYNGVPYTSSLSVTSAAVSQVMSERSLNPTVADLFTPVKGGEIHLMQWDDIQNAYISNEMASKQESVKVDFGPDPGIQAPEINEGGAIDKILSPITSVMPFLQKFDLTPHAVQCPIINIPFYDKSHSMDSFCILAENNKKLIALFFVICWTILSLVILVR